MIGYVYLTTNLINGKVYVGQHIAKKFEPERYIGSGVLIKRAISKYGFNKFKCELLAEAETQDELDQLEMYYIKRYNAMDPDIGYNLCEGGSGGNLGYVFTEEQKLHLSQVHMNKRPSDEAIKKQADKLRGRIVITNGQETKLIYEDELDIYIKLGWYRGRPAYSRSKVVVCFETNEIFDSLSAVLNKYPGAHALKRCVKSNYNSTCCGLHWYLIDDIERKKWLEDNIRR